MSEFFIDGYRVATEAELAALEQANAAGELDCGVLISGMVAELRQLRADAATHATVVKELHALVDTQRELLATQREILATKVTP